MKLKNRLKITRFEKTHLPKSRLKKIDASRKFLLDKWFLTGNLICELCGKGRLIIETDSFNKRIPDELKAVCYNSVTGEKLILCGSCNNRKR